MKKQLLNIVIFFLLTATLLAQHPIHQPINSQKPASGTDAADQDVVSMAPDFSRNAEEILAKQAQKKFLWQSLQEARPKGIAPDHLLFAPPPEDLAKLENAACETCPVNDEKELRLIGVHQAVNIRVDISDEVNTKQGLGVGKTLFSQDDGLVWTTAIVSEEATAMRIRFTDLDLGDDAALFVYNDFGQAFGPYTGLGPNNNGDFWSHTVHGDQVWVQLHAAPHTKI